jgi:hypothetical protein
MNAHTHTDAGAKYIIHRRVNENAPRPKIFMTKRNSIKLLHRHCSGLKYSVKTGDVFGFAVGAQFDDTILHELDLGTQNEKEKTKPNISKYQR